MTPATAGHVLVVGSKPGLTDSLRKAAVPALVVVGDGAAADRTVGPGVDVLPVTDPHDPGAVLAALARRPGTTVRGVAALDERSVVPAALLRSALGVPGTSPQVAIACRDKAVQKDAVRAAGLRVARAELVAPHEPHRVAAAVDACGGTVVVKPVDGVGAHLTTLARTTAQAGDAVARVHRAGRPALVEELVTGAEHHVDGWVGDGVVRFTSTARYRDNVLAVRSGAVVRSVLLPVEHPVQRAATTLAQDAVTALGLRTGVFHLEFFVEPDGGLVFSECGARPGGGFITQTVAARYGVDLRAVAVRLAVGEEVAAPTTVAEGSYGFTFLTADPGTVVRTPDTAAVLGLPGVLDVLLPFGPGQVVPDHRTSSGRRFGLALLTAPDDAALGERLDRTVEHVHRGTVVEAAP